MSSPLIGAAAVLEHLTDPAWRFIDTRYSLNDPLSGRRAYLAGHLPGAVFADLETDLSDEVQASGAGGRHPLPLPQVLATWLGAQGIGDGQTLVVYDDPSSAQGFYAAHAWWLLRWLGHQQVYVLNGGWPAYLAAGGRVSTDEPAHAPAMFTAKPQPGWLASADEVAALPESSSLIDSRAALRYRGEVEPIDKAAGHIPGARSQDWALGLNPDGTFKSAAEQIGRFPARDLVLYCGSGVSAAANLLALAIAGREPGPAVRLYAGSWSDWVSDASRPVATGREGEPGQTS